MNRNTSWIPFAAMFLCSLCFVASAEAHPGRTDASGCHNDRRNGGYHCHNGGNSGGSYRGGSGSSSEMLEPTSSVCPDGDTWDGFNGITSEFDNVNLRTGPSTNSRVIVVMRPNTRLTIHSWHQRSDGRWAWVTTEQGQSGYGREPLIECFYGV